MLNFSITSLGWFLTRWLRKSNFFKPFISQSGTLHYSNLFSHFFKWSSRFPIVVLKPHLFGQSQGWTPIIRRANADGRVLKGLERQKGQETSFFFCNDDSHSSQSRLLHYLHSIALYAVSKQTIHSSKSSFVYDYIIKKIVIFCYLKLWTFKFIIRLL